MVTGTNTQFAFPISFNDKLYFRTDDDEHGVELWESDATEEGTKLVQDINPGTDASWPEDYAVYKGYLCFNANGGNGNEGAELRYLDPDDAENPVKLMAYAIPGDGGAWVKKDHRASVRRCGFAGLLRGERTFYGESGQNCLWLRRSGSGARQNWCTSWIRQVPHRTT